MKEDYSQLLIDIQKKSNITVSDSKDLKFLKEEIESFINQTIGFNTLRRLFGFLEKREPNYSTLNRLANYLGYISFSKYKNNKTNYSDWYFQQYLLQIRNLKAITDAEIEIINSGIINENNIVYLAYYISFHIEKKNIKILECIFSKVHLQSVSGTQLHKFGIIISLSLSSISEKKALLIYEKLIQYDNFRNFLPLLNIDYSGLQKRYFNILKIIIKNNANCSDVFFANLMFIYKDYYIHKKIFNGYALLKPKKFSNYYVVLKGRYYGCCFLTNQKNLNKIKNEILSECSNNKISFFLEEIIPALIITNEYLFLEKIMERYYEELFEVDVWSNETTNAIYLIGLANVNWYNQRYISAKNNLELVELEKVELGYFNYISMFYYLTQIKISYSENDIETNKKAVMNLKKNIAKTFFLRFEEVAASYIIK
jgi:hypothetical protein